MSDITTSDVIAKVRELAAANPDYVYEPEYAFCKNYHVDEDGTPIEGSGCIIGQALHEVGFSYNKIPQSGRVLKVLRVLGMPSDGAVEGDWLETVQSYQDSEFSWGSAVEAANRKYPLT